MISSPCRTHYADPLFPFTSLFRSGRGGYASASPGAREGTLEPLFKTFGSHVPTPGLPEDGPFTFLATLLDRDNFIGRILTGRVQSGTIKVNRKSTRLNSSH